jgi:hypothetical protein
MADEGRETTSSGSDRFIAAGQSHYPVTHSILKKTSTDLRTPHTSQAAVELTRRAFPSLCNIPDQKITFEVAPDKDMEPFGPDIIILDDAWEAMATSPARPMLVSVRETHEETEKRGSNLDRLGSATKVDCLYHVALGTSIRQERHTSGKSGARTSGS